MVAMSNSMLFLNKKYKVSIIMFFMTSALPKDDQPSQIMVIISEN